MIIQNKTIGKYLIMIYPNNNIKFEVQSSNNSDELFSKLFWEEGYSIRGEWEFYNGIDYDFIDLLYFNDSNDKDGFISDLKKLVEFFHLESNCLNLSYQGVVKMINHFLQDDMNNNYFGFSEARDFYYKEVYEHNFYLNCFKMKSYTVFSKKNTDEENLNSSDWLVFEPNEKKDVPSTKGIQLNKWNFKRKLRFNQTDAEKEIQYILDYMNKNIVDILSLRDIAVFYYNSNKEKYNEIYKLIVDNCSEPSPFTMGMVYESLGKVSYENSNYEDSIRFFEKGLEYNPKLPVKKLLKTCYSKI